MSLTLYGLHLSNNVNLVVATLAVLDKLKDTKVVAVAVDILNKTHRTPEFLAVSPAGQIPALVDPDYPGYLIESDAISRYLIKKYKSNLLGGDDLASQTAIDVAHSHIRQKIWDAAGTYTFHKAYFPMFFGGKSGDAAKAAEAEKTLDEKLAFINNQFFRDSKFLVGKELTFADLTLLTAVEHAHANGGYEIKQPKILELVKYWESLPTFASTNYAKQKK